MKPLETKMIIDQDTILIGQLNRANLKIAPCATWFTPAYDEFNPDKQWVKNMSRHTESLTMKLFIGTWCDDSKILVPKLLKVIDALPLEDSQLEIFALDREKNVQEAFAAVRPLVTKVPTLIVYRGGKELNRIVEFPVVSITDDLEKIITNQSYTPISVN